MAKIKVTKVNFEGKALEALKNSKYSFLGGFAEEMGVDLSKVPEKQTIYIDTDKIAIIDEPLSEELGGGAFMVHMAYGGEKEVKVNIANECFDELLKAWKGE